MSDELHSLNLNTIDVASFYGLNSEVESDVERKHISRPPLKGLPHRLNNLLGPTQIWRVFKKQGEALDFAKKSRNGLMTFAFQQSDGARLFLVAHPKIFWHYDIQKSVLHRCAYEIIPESTACKLYFDIEFETKYNPEKEGSSVVDTFIVVVIYFLSTLFNIQVGKENVLNLDSSTDKKFSCHLIFQLKSYAFSDNKVTGAFVNFICRKLRLYFDSSNQKQCLSGDETELSLCDFSSICGCCKGSNLITPGCIQDIGLSAEALKNLIVFDRKGNKHLICDLSVYSRNRHFRLFQNTKWGKNSPLVVSKDNYYIPQVKKGNHNGDLLTETLFLDSLVTYFRTSEVSFHDIQVIDFTSHFVSEIFETPSTGNKFNLPKPSIDPQLKSLEAIPGHAPPYPALNNFINSLVFPGHIWRSTFFNSTSVIVYDIVGNRYCHNIKRQHQSNNVKYIVNLNSYVYYQKCHDSECSSFRSETHQLPPELKFQLEDDVFASEDIDVALMGVECTDINISESDLLEAISAIEDLSTIISDDEL